MLHNRFVCTVFILLFACGCDTKEGIKEIKEFKNSSWLAAKSQEFILEVKDSKKVYEFYYLLRNDVNYPYYNIFLKQRLIDPSGAVLKSTIDEITLFEPKTGKPLGDGMGDLFDHKVKAPGLKRIVFPVPGKYKWVITHNMRPDPLVGILFLGAELVPVK